MAERETERRAMALYGPCEVCGAARMSIGYAAADGVWTVGMVCSKDTTHGPDEVRPIRSAAADMAADPTTGVEPLEPATEDARFVAADLAADAVMPLVSELRVWEEFSRQRRHDVHAGLCQRAAWALDSLTAALDAERARAEAAEAAIARRRQFSGEFFSVPESWPARDRLAAVLCHTSRHYDGEFDFCDDCLAHADLILDEGDYVAAVVAALETEIPA